MDRSWVGGMLRFQKAEKSRVMKGMHKAQEDVNQNHNRNNSGSWEMLSLEEALASLEEGMLPLPTIEDFVCILHKCRKERNLLHTLRLHSYMRKCGLEAHAALGNYLISTLVEVGSMCHAQQVFDSLVHRNECSWNNLITGYVKQGEAQQALTLYQKMQEDESLHPRAYTFVALLKACAKLKHLERGCKIHTEISKKGLLERDIFIGSTLVRMYARCGSLKKAQEVFDKLPVRNVVTWNALIAGYVEQGYGEEALVCFEQMQHQGISPDLVTFVCSLKACGSIGATLKGQEIHAEVVRKALEAEILVGNTLIDIYSKFGSLTEAQEVFNKLPLRTLVSWTALISGYAEHGRAKEAFYWFEQTQHEDLSLDAVSYVYGLKACGSIKATEKGQAIHDEIVRKGFLERDLVVGSTLVGMYIKCGLLAEAKEVFDKLPIRDVVLWTALIAGYLECGCGEEALNCFTQMQQEGISSDVVTLVCSLKACGSIGASVKGREIHAEIARRGLETEFHIGSTLVDMYAKCGLVAEAHEVFDKLSGRNVVVWSSLIAGYAQLGESENVCDIFDRMVGDGVKPDLVTFLSVLNACNHAGLVDKGQMYFEAISNDYGLIPTLEHYTCIVDLLSRAGHIDKTIAMIKKMPIHPGMVLWHTVLGACRKWGNVELGRQAFEHAVQLDEEDAAAYVYMSNIYADADMQDHANKMEAIRVEKQTCKKQRTVGGWG